MEEFLGRVLGLDSLASPWFARDPGFREGGYPRRVMASMYGVQASSMSIHSTISMRMMRR